MNLTLLLLTACSSRPGPAPEAPVPEPATAPEPGTVPEVAPNTPIPAPADVDPQALYASCEGRVEQPQSPGECASDDDCTRAGCSNELCIAKSAGQLSTTCEVRPCFAVLEACGCSDGQCVWTVGEPAATP